MESRSANWRHAARETRSTRSTPRLLLQLFVMLAMVFAVVVPQGISAKDKESAIHPALAEAMAANPQGTFRVIVQRVDDSREADDAVVKAGGSKRRDMKIDGFVADMSVKAIEKLGRHPKIKQVSLDAEMNSTGYVSNSSLVTLFPKAVNASNLWDELLTGQGIGIAVLDSGINNNTGDWSTLQNRIVARQVFLDVAPTALDTTGHGSMVAGIAAGNSWNHPTTALRGKYMGIAPEANVIDLVVTDATGKSYTSDVVDAIEWAITNRVTYNIRVMNLSMVSSVAESYKTSILAAAVERAWFSGIFVVVAAGNGGPNTLQYPPANDPFVVTVGASDMKGTVSRGDDGLAPWSSYGNTQDGYNKPDVVAPGRFIAAPVSSSSSSLFTRFPTRALSNTSSKYMWMSGTSMSAPIIAGIAALAFQNYPGWTNDQLKWVITSGKASDLLAGVNAVQQGAGLIDADRVVWYQWWYNQTPGYANQGLTRSNHLVVSGAGTLYNSASWSSASWSSASWSSASWSSASWSSASWSSTAQMQTSDVDVGMTGYTETTP